MSERPTISDRPTQEIPAKDLEAMVRISAQLEAAAEPLRDDLRRLVAAIGDVPPRLWTGSLLGIILDVFQESHPRNELAGAVLGIGVAMFYRPGAELTPITDMVATVWAEFSRMTTAPDPEPD